MPETSTNEDSRWRAPNDSQDCYEEKEDVTFTHLLVVSRFAIFLNIYLCHFENVIPTENNKVVCV